MWGLKGFRVVGLGFRVWILRVLGFSALGFRVQGLGLCCTT